MKNISRMLRNLYRTHFAEKLFNKILLTYSGIIVITLAALAFFITQYFTQYMTNKEMIQIQEMSKNVNGYIDQRIENSRLVLEIIHSNDNFLRQFEVLLRDGYEAYMQSQLNQYLDKNTPTTSPFKTVSPFFKSGFDIDSLLFYSSAGDLYRITEQLSLEIVSKELYSSLSPIQQEAYADKTLIFPVITEESQDKPLFAYTAQLKNPNTLQPFGTIVIQFNASGFMKSLLQLTLDTNRNKAVIVMTLAGDVIFDSTSQWYGKTFPSEKLLVSDANQALGDDDWFYTISTANKAGVIVAGMISSKQLYDGTKLLQRWIIIVTTICIVTALFLTYILIIRFSLRTKVIVRAMEKLDSGQWNIQIPHTKRDELYQISSTFNRMSERVNDYIEKVYLSEIKQKNAELVAMQMQMNPHFLYNTLEAIRMNAVIQGAPQVGHMIFLLANLFRTTMKSAMIVGITEEIERCRVYLELFQIRYPDQLRVDITIPEELEACTILKLSIQPLVENYVLYGFKSDRFDNVISIAARKENNTIFIDVIDNGKGIDNVELEKIRQNLTSRNELETTSDSLGLRNVHTRIRLYYGEEYGLTIESQQHAGTTVTLKILSVDKE